MLPTCKFVPILIKISYVLREDLFSFLVSN